MQTRPPPRPRGCARSDLRPTRWPDFMQKKDRASYPSQKALGLLFRDLKAACDAEEAGDVPVGAPEPAAVYDADLEVDGWREFAASALRLREEYAHEMRVLMDHFQARSTVRAGGRPPALRTARARRARGRCGRRRRW